LETAADTSHWHMDLLLGQLGTRQSAIQFHYGERAPPKQVSTTKGKKRALPDNDHPQPHIKKSRIRTCARCKRTNCRGAFLSRPCDPVDTVRTTWYLGPSMILAYKPSVLQQTDHQASLLAMMQSNNGMPGPSAARGSRENGSNEIVSD